ncbi:hypothetical protein BJY52DRAFT_273150 [Lactarius psammicola]|nr:hypothetical protein BJY52DRAFT_273150 [Lactarius psammicola]
MDQAAPAISMPASALCVTFCPDLVLARSGVTSEKFVHLRMCYNFRVVRVFAAGRILARHLDIDVDHRELVILQPSRRHFGGVSEAGWPEDFSKLCVALEKMIDHIGNLGPADA